MRDNKRPYEILEVNINADWEEIEQAYTKKKEISDEYLGTGLVDSPDLLLWAKINMQRPLLSKGLAEAIKMVRSKKNEIDIQKDSLEGQAKTDKEIKFHKLYELEAKLNIIHRDVNITTVDKSCSAIKAAFLTAKTGLPERKSSFVRFINSVLETIGGPFSWFKMKTSSQAKIEKAEYSLGKRVPQVKPIEEPMHQPASSSESKHEKKKITSPELPYRSRQK